MFHCWVWVCWQLKDDQEYSDIKEEVADECRKYGEVV
jgi:hypothetical protein